MPLERFESKTGPILEQLLSNSNHLYLLPWFAFPVNFQRLQKFLYVLAVFTNSSVFSSNVVTSSKFLPYTFAV